MIYVWKDWKEQLRGKGIWFSMSMVVLISLFILLQSRQLPWEQGFEVFLVSLFKMNLYLLPLLSLFIASFSVMQEKEQKTLLILVTRSESYRSFLWKKSLSIQCITLALMIGWYFILAVPLKLFFSFHAGHFIAFIVTISILLMIFNQFGILWGSVCSNRMQLLGANLFTWFFFIFLIDLVTLFYLPAVTYDNISAFSWVYFLDPVHALHMYLETQTGMFPLNQMSRMMDKMVWLSPSAYVLINLLVWTVLSFELSVFLGRRGGK